MIYYIKNFLSVTDMEKVGPFKSRAYTNRIKAGREGGMKIDTEWFVRTTPERVRKVLSIDDWPETPQTFANVPGDFMKLHRAAAKLKIRTSTIYEEVIMSGVDLYVIGGNMFVYLSKVRAHLQTVNRVKRRR